MTLILFLRIPILTTLFRFGLIFLALLGVAGCQKVDPIAKIPQPVVDVPGPKLIASDRWTASNNPEAIDLGLDYKVVPINTGTIRQMRREDSDTLKVPGTDRYEVSLPKAFEPGVYRIGTGDELEITVTLPGVAAAEGGAAIAPTAQSVVSTVDDAGRISIPQAGSIRVAGVSLAGAKKRAKKRAKTALSAIIKEPEVFLRVVKYGSRYFSRVMPS